MKIKLECDVTPAEARAFLGLPDVTELNAHVVESMKGRMDEMMARTAPEEIMKTWMAFGGQAVEQFRKVVTAAAGSTAGR
jgi:Family of unknown function (DUF6489)